MCVLIHLLHFPGTDEVSATLDILTCDNKIILDNVSCQSLVSQLILNCFQTLRARLVDPLPTGTRLTVRPSYHWL
jgi:hypothetical protein